MGLDDKAIEKRSNRQIKIGSILNIVLILADVLSGLLFIPWFIKSLGTSNYAIYSLSISIVNMFIIDLGLGNAVNRYVAKYKSENDEVGLENFLSTVYKMYLILAAAISVALVIFYFFINNIYNGLTSSEIEKLKIAYLITGFFSVVIFSCQPFNGILNAYEKFAFLKGINVIQKVIYVIFAIIILKMGFGLIGAVFWHSLSNFILSFVKYLYVRFGLKLKVKLSIRMNRSLLKDVFVFTFWITIVSIASRLAVSFSSSILGIVSNSTQISIYSIAVTIESYSYLIGSIVGGFFIAKISRISEDKNIEIKRKKITNLFVVVSKINIILIMIIFVGFVTCGNRFMKIWLGSEYRIDSYFSSVLLIIPQLIYTPTQIIYSAMVVEKKVKPLAIITLIFSAINIGLTFLLGYLFGAVGAALSYCLSQFAKQVVFCICYSKNINFDWKLYFKKTFIRIPLISLLLILFGFVINMSLPEDGILSFLKMVVLIGSLYCLMVIIFGLSKEERRQYLKI